MNIFSFHFFYCQQVFFFFSFSFMFFFVSIIIIYFALYLSIHY